MKLGEGTHVYEVVEGWAKLPPSVTLGYTHGVVEDSKGRILVHNQSKDAVIIFDREGNYISSWGEDFKDGAHGMFLSKEGRDDFLYLADYARHKVYKTTLDGEVLWSMGAPELPQVYQTQDQFNPTDVCVAPNGDFYVCDGYGQPWIHQYKADRTYVRSWGGLGSEPGKLNCPHGVWVDTRSKEPVLLCADRGNNRIQIFSLDGQHLGFVTDELRMPCCFWQHGDEIVIPDLSARVTILDRNNKLIVHLGDDPGVWDRPGYPNIPHADRKPGKFISPHAVCVDANDDIYVVEWVSDGRITKLARVK